MARTTAVCHPYSSPCLGPEPEPCVLLLLSLAETLSLTLDEGSSDPMKDHYHKQAGMMIAC